MPAPTRAAARFGVTPHLVRQRLRLGAVSPKLMQIYCDGDLALEQLMAFAITDDYARQEGVPASGRSFGGRQFRLWRVDVRCRANRSAAPSVATGAQLISAVTSSVLLIQTGRQRDFWLAQVSFRTAHIKEVTM
jgi:hypothetical protein